MTWSHITVILALHCSTDFCSLLNIYGLSLFSQPSPSNFSLIKRSSLIFQKSIVSVSIKFTHRQLFASPVLHTWQELSIKYTLSTPVLPCNFQLKFLKTLEVWRSPPIATSLLFLSYSLFPSSAYEGLSIVFP